MKRLFFALGCLALAVTLRAQDAPQDAEGYKAKGWGNQAGR